MLKKLLVAIGDSSESVKVSTSAIELAEKLDAQIILLHVLNPLIPHGFNTLGNPLVGGFLPIIDEGEIARYTEQWQAYESQGNAMLQTHAERARQRQIFTEIIQEYGDTGPTICKVADAQGVDAIVMGRNQKSTLNEILLGSNSNYVFHHARCSIIAIK